MPDQHLPVRYNQAMRSNQRKPTEIPHQIFKAYDIRGIYPTEINPGVVDAIARAFVVYIRPWSVVVGRDVRASGDKLFPALKKALLESGVDVIDIGTVPVDVFYFASGTLDVDGGIFVSASHNPREWNGLKFSRRGAEPISSDSGMKEIYTFAVSGASLPSRKNGRLFKRNILPAYFDFIRSTVPLEKTRKLRIALNGNFGMSAKLFRTLIEKYNLPFTVFGLNLEPDGSFPKGAPNPLLPENREEMSRFVLKKKADLGIAWDSDGDRCFLVDEKGQFGEGCFTTAILIEEILTRYPGGVVIVDPRLVWAARDVVSRLNGRLLINRPGYSLIAERMKKENAMFAGEMSGHFYFANNFNRDNGFLPALYFLQKMLKEGKKASQIFLPFRKAYFISGELNFPLPEQEHSLKILEEAERRYAAGKIEHIDGLSVEYSDWRFNLRASNTEPLLRLNIEARSPKLVREKVAEIKKLIAEFL